MKESKVKVMILLGMLALTAYARWGGGGDSTTSYYWWWDNQANPDGNGANGQPRGDVPPFYWNKVTTGQFTDPNGLPAPTTVDIHTMPSATYGFHKADEPQAYTLVDSFWYYNKWYKPGDKLYISPDGWVSFEHSNPASNPSSKFPYIDNIPAIIGIYWANQQALGADPVTPSEPQTVYYHWKPSTRQLIVEWYQVQLNSNPNRVYTYGLVLQFGGQYITWNKPGCGVSWSGHFIDFIYRNYSGSGNPGWYAPANWLVGIEDQTEATGLTVDSPYTTTHEVANGIIVRFGFGRIFRFNVEAYKILSPGKMVLRYTQIQPKVIVHNDSKEIVSFPLTFKIDSVGGKTVYGPYDVNVSSLGVDKADTVEFSCWDSPGDIGAHYQTVLTTNFDRDECRADDTLKKDLWVGCDDTLAHWPLEPSRWTFGSDSTGMLDGIWYSSPNGALLNGAVLNIAKDIPDNNYGNWSIQVWLSNASGNPNAAVATGLKPASYGSGYNTVVFTSPLWVSTAASGLGSRFWLFYATDGVKGLWDQYRLMQPPRGSPQSSLVSGLWYTGPHSFSFSPYGPTITSGWYANHYEPLLPASNPREPVANLIPDLQAITHLVLDARPLPPCYAKWERDLATVSIDEPHQPFIEVGHPVTPKSTVANLGRNTEPDPPVGCKYFTPSKCTITNALTGAVAFNESTSISKISIGWLGDPADNPDTLHFSYGTPWIPTDGGERGFGVPYKFSYSVNLGVIGPDKSDHCPHNDTKEGIFTALWSHDVGVDYNPNVPGPGEDTAQVNGIIFPPPNPEGMDTIRAHQGGTINIQVMVRNYGFYEEGPFNVECTIKDMLRNDSLIYTHWYQVSFLDWRSNTAGNPDSIYITFPVWDVPDKVEFKYLLEVRTLLAGDGVPEDRTFLAGDQCPANDFQRVIFGFNGVDEDNSTLPRQFDLSVAKPNPFFGSTKITYALPKPSEVKLRIYDLQGRQVKVLVNERKDAGWFSVNWTCTDDNCRRVSTGIYIVRFEAPGYTATRKLIVVTK